MTAVRKPINKNARNIVRAFLQEARESMTVPQIAAATGLAPQSVRSAIGAMPDVYVDRWTGSVQGLGQLRWVRCFALADIPPDAEKPTHKPTPADVEGATR